MYNSCSRVSPPLESQTPWPQTTQTTQARSLTICLEIHLFNTQVLCATSVAVTDVETSFFRELNLNSIRVEIW